MVPSAARVVRLLVALLAMSFALASAAAAAGCPGAIVYQADNTSLLDAGWTGRTHDLPVIGWALRMGVSGCAGSTVGSCGQCSITGLIANAGGSNQRCTNDTSIKCTSNAPCTPGGGTCSFFATPPNPVAGGGTAACITNEVTAAVSGTVDVEGGDLSVAVPMRSSIYNQLTPSSPCPQCNGDPTPNDNMAAGTCSGGARGGLACDANATSPVPAFGTTSFDCPPNPAAFLGSVAIATQALTTSTDAASVTLSAASPVCHGTFAGERCHCDTCDNAAATPCMTDADCVAAGAALCGGKRCLGGTNAGAPCVNSSACPGGGICGRPGEVTKPDGCLDDTVTMGPVCIDTAPLDDEGECINGPITSHCAAPEEFRGCTTPAECPLTANCVSENLRCFPGEGAIGSSVIVTGQATSRSGNTSNPTDLGALFCIGATGSNVPNVVAGFPGPARLNLFGTLTYADEVRIQNVGAGATVSTDAGEGDGATPTDIVETSVTTPTTGAGGEVTILETTSVATPPPGFVVLGSLVQITAPAGTTANPLAIVFRIDGSAAPGQSPAGVIVKRNGAPVPDCSSVLPAAISPDPCVFQRSVLGDDIRIAVYTSAASDWEFSGPLVPTPTPTLTVTPTGLTATPTPTSTPSGDPTGFTATPTPTAPTVTPTKTPTPTATPLCAATPDVCRTPVVGGSALVSLVDKSPDSKDQLRWTWSKGAATTRTDFGDPVNSDDYVVCVYDGSGLRATLLAPAGGTCAGKPCWKSTSKGFQYKDKDASPNGIAQLKLGAGSIGKAKIQLKGKGTSLPDLDLTTLTSPVTVELKPTDGSLCWSAQYSFPLAIKNDAVQFKDKAD